MRTLAVISLLLLSGCVAVNRPDGHGGTGIDDSNTIYPLTTLNPTLPTFGGATYPGQLYNSLAKESAGRWYEQGWGNQVSIIANANACLGTTGGSLTMTPVSCIAYNAGYRGTETGPITFPNNSACWAAMDENTTGNNSGLPNFTRVPATHYLIDCIDSGQPSMVGDSQLLMKVTTSGGAITVVSDKRSTNVVLPANITNLSITNALTVGGNSTLTGNLSVGGTTSLMGALTLGTVLSETYGGTGNAVGPYSALMGSSGAANIADTDYMAVSGGGLQTFGNVKKVDVLAPRAGTIGNLYCFVATAPASGTWSFQLSVNDVTVNLFCTISNANTVCHDTVDTIPIAAGDRLATLISAILGSPGASAAACSYSYQS